MRRSRGTIQKRLFTWKRKIYLRRKIERGCLRGDWVEGEMTGKAKFIKFKDHIYEGDFERGLVYHKGK